MRFVSEFFLLFPAPSFGFHLDTVRVPKPQRIAQSNHMEEGLEEKEDVCIHFYLFIYKVCLKMI